MSETTHTYPEKILSTVRSDMMAYHKHSYTFEEYCDRNTHGRNYGKELYPIWQETKARYDEEHDSVPENHSDAGQEETKNRRGKRKQHV